MNRILHAAATGAALFAAACTTGAQSQSAIDFAPIVEERTRLHDVPGAYVAVVENGRVAFEHAHGTEELDGEDRFGAGTKGRLASASKFLAGLAFLSMAEDGLLDFDETLGDIDGSLPEAFAALPVWSVLNHTSGLPMMVIRDDFNAMTPEEQAAMTGDDVLAMIAGEPVDFAPGEGWHYQQSGYALLARALERRTGKSFLALLDEHVLEPAGTQNTGFTPIRDLAPAYTGENGALEWQAAGYAPALASAGGIETTGEDLTRIFRALGRGRIVSLGFLEAEVLRGDRLYRLGSDAEGEGYGMAMIVQRYGDVWTIGHSGGGGLADIRYAPEAKTGIIALTNRAGGTGVASEITTLISTELFGEGHIKTED